MTDFKPRLVESVRITADEKLLIDGEPFPWHIAEEGPQVIDEGGDVPVVRLMVPILLVSDVPLVDERPAAHDHVRGIVREMGTHQTLMLKRLYEALGQALEEVDDGQ